MLKESALDYEQLIAEDQHYLCSLLRGHCSPDFLEIWPPDEDRVKLLLNVVEAAPGCGQERIVLEVAPAIADLLHTEWLLELLASFRTPTLERAEGGFRFIFADLSARNESQPPYRRAVDPCAVDSRFLGSLRREHKVNEVLDASRKGTIVLQSPIGTKPLHLSFI